MRSKSIIAHPAHQSTREPEPQPAYVLRGHGLFELHREDLVYLGGGKWLIPSGSKADVSYEVRVGSPRHPERSRCECVGFQHHGHCSHLVCAAIAHRRSAVCDACGERKYWPELTQVHEDDELLAWFPGDVLCDDCVPGQWS
jgi:hypothetical protein